MDETKMNKTKKKSIYSEMFRLKFYLFGNGSLTIYVYPLLKKLIQICFLRFYLLLFFDIKILPNSIYFVLIIIKFTAYYSKLYIRKNVSILIILCFLVIVFLFINNRLDNTFKNLLIRKRIFFNLLF